jgi:putative ABC transport system permease protein
MDTFFNDLTFALRGLRKNPGFAFVATITIALGIAACTSIFSVVNAVLLRPLPYSDARRLVIVWGELRNRGVKDWTFSPPDYRDLRLQTTAVFEDAAAVTTAGRTPISENNGQPEQIRVAGATPNAFRVLGARVLLGRDFVEDDATPQAPPPPPGQGAAAPPRLPTIAIISHGLWTRRYGRDPQIVGRTVELGNGRAQIVGVLGPDFELLIAPRANVERVPDMWTALRINYETANRNNVGLHVIARLKPGVTIDQAQEQIDRVAADLRKVYPIKTTAGLYFHAVPMFDDLVSGVRPAILSLMGAVAFVLLIACANVANLLLVRASARSRELAIRSAMGGSRWRLVRQMLVESLAIAAFGTALGVLLSRGAVRVLMTLGPEDLPRLTSIAIDPIVLTFAIFAGLVTAMICGVVPALRASRTDVMEVLRHVSARSYGLQGGRRLRHGVVVVEVALSFILLVGAGLMLRSFAALGRVHPGFNPQNVLTFFLPAQFPQPEQRAAFKRQLRERLLAIPGVQAVTAATPLPLDGNIANGRWGTEAAMSDPTKFRQADVRFVLPGYFDALGTRVIAGRTFVDADNNVDQTNRTPKQIVIDDLVAARAFPNQSAVGQRLLARVVTPESEEFEVIGVVGHQRHAGLATDGPEAIFFVDGYAGHGAASRWVVRTNGDPNLFAAAVRAAVADVNPRAVVAEMQPMQAFVDKAMAPITFTTTLIGVFAIVAVALASIGLYGVLATIVRQRTAEIGMRMVFGAQRGSIRNLIVGEGLRLSGAGIVVGFVAAFAVTRVMATMLVGITPTDPLTFAGIVVLFLVLAGAASYLPAMRAARLDPMEALRDE